MKRSSFISGTIIVFWAILFAAVYLFLRAHHIPPHLFPHYLRFLMLKAGPWGVGILFGSYVCAVAIPIPTTAFALIAGTAYGSFAGSLIAIVGYNLSTTIGFWGGRLVGQRFVRERANTWMKKYDRKLREEGLLTVFFMRLFFFPSEFVNILCGMTSMRFRSFAVGTFFGSLPWILTFALLGHALTHARVWTVFLIVFIVCGTSVLLLRQSTWAKRALSSADDV